MNGRINHGPDEAQHSELQKRFVELEAARIAYASEFDGDTGSIHENIRKLKAENQSYREALAHLIAHGGTGQCTLQSLITIAEKALEPPND
jgi:hypothetical protein